MTVGRRTLALTTVGCALAASGGAALAATQHSSTSQPAKTIHVAKPTAAQHHCPHMGMAGEMASSSNL
ncbi:MAG TPA: hypothetical protein VLN26_02575 [Gaiellaceae bacterium]|nr:hypothetical protein [Gaiellaceae bacterium]